MKTGGLCLQAAGHTYIMYGTTPQRLKIFVMQFNLAALVKIGQISII